MRIVCQLFEDGTREIYTTENRGGNMKFREGGPTPPQIIRRIVASVEAVYDDNSPNSLVEALHKVESMLPVSA